MRRCVVGIVFVVLATASNAPASAAAHGDFVTGTARHLGADPPFPAIQVHINARSHPKFGPRGNVVAKIKTLGVKDRARVTCLSVFGNRATVGTEIVKSNDPELEGHGQLWSVVDNGQSGDADRIAGYPITAEPPTGCPLLFFDVPVVMGNYVIHAAAP